MSMCTGMLVFLKSCRAQVIMVNNACNDTIMLYKLPENA